MLALTRKEQEMMAKMGSAWDILRTFYDDNSHLDYYFHEELGEGMKFLKKAIEKMRANIAHKHFNEQFGEFK